MQATIWALLPPLIAIVLALITKEVYSSLFVGIAVGGLFYANFGFEGAINHIVNDGFIAVLSDSWNVGIIIFLVILGTLVCLMNAAGGSAAFGDWAQKHIKTRVGTQLATILLGCIIFIDDYFNCLTVGSVMKPITDKHKISREKLAYLIDATAAPICIIAPVSSWAAAVTGFVKGTDGFSLFLKAIPYNYYALFTILFMVGMVALKIDFGPMAGYERNAIKNNDVDADGSEIKDEGVKKGKVIDLVFPILILIVSCIAGMIYTGGFFAGETFIDAFANSDASVGLAMGSMVALLITILFYLVRKALPFKDCIDCIPKGVTTMIPAILILTLAWTLKAMTDSLQAGEFVARVVNDYLIDYTCFIPGLIFVIAALLAFATGTSWGTFGILIPIVVSVFEKTDPVMMIISISACMAGAVCGDHCSPISDTTIMASAGAQCNHVRHVSTQMPYAFLVAVISFINYIIAGFVKNAVVCLVIGVIITGATLAVIKYLSKTETVEE